METKNAFLGMHVTKKLRNSVYSTAHENGRTISAEITELLEEKYLHAEPPRFSQFQLLMEKVIEKFSKIHGQMDMHFLMLRDLKKNSLENEKILEILESIQQMSSGTVKSLNEDFSIRLSRLESQMREISTILQEIVFIDVRKEGE